MSDSKIIRAKLRQLLPTLDFEVATQRTIQARLEDELGIPLDEYKAVLKAEVDAYLLRDAEGEAGGHQPPPASPPPAKKHKAAAAEAVPSGGQGPPGFLFAVPISAKRYAGVRTYNKRPLLDVREFYEQAGALAPGAKGLSLSPEQWAALVAALGALSEALGAGDEAFFVDLGANKRAGVSVYAGKTMLSLREHYEKGGAMLPGKKGLSLPPDQWAKLCAAAGDLTRELEAVAGPLPAPKPPAAPGADGAGTSAGPADAAAAGPPGCVSLAPMRRAEVSEWKGRRMVSIREFYVADGELRHGKKGMQLAADQFAALRAAAGAVSAALQAGDAAYELQLAPK
jgi:hypothetical protein